MTSKKGGKKPEPREQRSGSGGSPGRAEPPAGDPAEPAPEAAPARDGRFPIVGMGASAGGLGALERFFEAMPADSGMAFVVVTHQMAGHPSMLAELLGRKTAMPVVEVKGPMLVERDHVYTAHPGLNLAILHGVLQPIESHDPPPLHLPVDFFFRSLAQDQRDRAIGIVLSGTGADGSLGLKEIKGELGMVMAQEEQTAQYSGMPHSAIATELVDYVLPVDEMPKQLLSYAEALIPGRPRVVTPAQPDQGLQQLFVLIRDRTGHDFSQYKRSTISRRIERRMNVHDIDSVKHYVGYLQSHPVEIDLLFKELLIGVTSFFRDPDAWVSLSGAVADLLKGKPDGYVVRAWVPGCATGEEAYSLAILLREAMDSLKRSLSVQIFATDLDASAIDVARAGVYPVGIVHDVTTKRLARFFTQEDDTYRVRKEIREMLVFAPQNLIADPPFTKIDLLSCRNLLIYLDTPLQKRLLPIFHYALRRQGILFLGSSESVGPFNDLFTPVDKKWKIFRRQDVAGSRLAEFPAGISELPDTAAAGAIRRVRAATGARVDQGVIRMLLRDLVPPTVVIQERGDVVHVHGKTGLFLEPAQGDQSSANVFNMAREGLQLPLSAAIRQASIDGQEVVERGVRIKSNGDYTAVDLHVVRLKDPEPLRGLYRVTFAEPKPVVVRGDHRSADEVKPPERVAELERELQYLKESHQSTTEELETANEELKSTNEELQSTNEELQSANEELGTSKEEMQSLNEELQTVNAELQGKVDELSRVNNDLKNLLNATDIATVFLDSQLRIKRYTEQARKVIRLIPSDVGRYVGDLVSTLHYDGLVDDAREVLRTLVFKETTVQGEANKTYLMRILPYRTTDNVIDGLVLTFVEVTRLKAVQLEQQRLLHALRGSLATVVGYDRDLRIIWASAPAFGRSPIDLIGRTDDELFAGDDATRLREIKEDAMLRGRSVRHRLDLGVDGRQKTYELYLEPSRDESDRITGVTTLVVDVTTLG